MALQLSITTPEGQIHQGEASLVVVPGVDGELGILPRHAPLIGVLGVGELRVKGAGPGSSSPGSSGPGSSSTEKRFFIDGGFVQVLKDRVVVLATRAEPAGSIDRARAEEELKRLQAEPLPAKSPLEARTAREERIRAAKARLKAAGRTS